MPNAFNIPIIIDEAAGDDIFLLPQVHPVVYLAPNQTEPTLGQELAAILEAYTQAAKRGEVAILRGVKP